jgi:hypothetical protein
MTATKMVQRRYDIRNLRENKNKREEKERDNNIKAKMTCEAK